MYKHILIFRNNGNGRKLTMKKGDGMKNGMEEWKWNRRMDNGKSGNPMKKKKS